MIDLRECLAARAELAESDYSLDAFEPEIVARIVRATGAFNFRAVGDSTGVMS